VGIATQIAVIQVFVEHDHPNTSTVVRVKLEVVNLTVDVYRRKSEDAVGCGLRATQLVNDDPEAARAGRQALDSQHSMTSADLSHLRVASIITNEYDCDY
jgi:hypothetical protein